MPGLAAGTPPWLAVSWIAAIGAATLRRPRAAVALSGIAGVATSFFRDPDRQATAEGVLAPADGRITVVDRRPDGRVRVATYMSLRDVHVNRAPCDGVVIGLRRRRGGYLPAWHKDSERNERMDWRLSTPHGELEIVQIAGILARRIVPYHAPGARLQRGQRLGLIRFGSRVDVVLPPGVEAAVAVGDRVRAGDTRIARLS